MTVRPRSDGGGFRCVLWRGHVASSRDGVCSPHDSEDAKTRFEACAARAELEARRPRHAALRQGRLCSDGGSGGG